MILGLHVFFEPISRDDTFLGPEELSNSSFLAPFFNVSELI